MNTILIIEDEEVLLEVLKEKLTHEGYSVSTAANGELGLSKVRGEKPDLVLLDIVMPKMGGFEVMREIAKDKELSHIPVIVISNSGQPVEIEEAMRLGAKDFLIKAEFDPQEVIGKVKKYLDGETQRRNQLEASHEEAMPSSPRKVIPTDIKVLIVEDDKFLRDLIVQKLSNEGFVVSEAIDGEEGLTRVKETIPDLVLLDLILPGVDGFEVLRRMKEDPKTADIPVIILSNLGQKEDVERGLKLGARDYLIKAHFTPSEIIEKVKNVVGERS